LSRKTLLFLTFWLMKVSYICTDKEQKTKHGYI